LQRRSGPAQSPLRRRSPVKDAAGIRETHRLLAIEAHIDWAAALAWTGETFRPTRDLQARIRRAAAWMDAAPAPAVQYFLDVAARIGVGA